VLCYEGVFTEISARKEIEQASPIAAASREDTWPDGLYVARTLERRVALLSKGEMIAGPVSQLPAVLADADQLANVLANRLSNALDYTNPGDEVVVSATVDLWQDQPMIRCQVADSGLGIHPEDLPRLFDRFFRGRSALEQTIPDNGLGLSISKKIIGRHGGHVTVKSNLEEGSIFTVRLPIAGY
jgi:signal transduction histidine kinase